MMPSSRITEPATPPLRVVQIGCGAWGHNILRELVSHPRVEPVLVVDSRAAARDKVASLAPRVPVADSLAALADVRADAAVVVTPGPLHAEHAAIALARGLHVFVEKPMTTSLSDAVRLCALAREQRVVGMVGHLLHHHPAAVAMIDVVRSGRLGAPVRVRSDRCSIAGSRDVDGSILWSLAPHDLSMIGAIDPSPMHVQRVDVFRTSQAGAPIEADVHVKTARGLTARVCLSRVADRKTRRIQIECEHGTITFDDVVSSSKLVVVDRRDGAERIEPVPYDTHVSPLAAEVNAFVCAILDNDAAHADFDEGADVVRVIEAATAMSRATPTLGQGQPWV